MNRVLKIIIGVLLAALAIYLIYRFSNIVTYLFISIILSLIGRPLVRRFNRLRIGNFHFPNALSAILALSVMLLIIITFLGIFVPLIASQAAIISEIDFAGLGNSVQEPLYDLEFFLKKYKMLAPEETIRQIVADQLTEILNLASFSKTVSSIVGVTGSIFIATFSILFLTFFFMKDAYLLEEMVDSLTPTNYLHEVNNVLLQTKFLLSRYFIGLLIELTTMVTLLSTGLSIFGVQNALLIGFFGGMMNIIPYLGPVIGATVGMLLAVFSALSAGMLSEVLPLIFIVLGVFAGANLIDNTVLQPLIYSNSVKAHPVEIFLVILIAGSMAGIPGMILAIPSYTILRVVAKEFLSQFKVVQRLTKNI